MSDKHLTPAEAYALELLINEARARTDVFCAVPASHRPRLSSALVKLEQLARSSPSRPPASDDAAEAVPAGAVDGRLATSSQRSAERDPPGWANPNR